MRLTLTITFTLLFLVASQGQNSKFDESSLIEINKWIAPDIEKEKYKGL